MTDPQSELVAATRLLVQWGRGRQATWHDPSRDLLAALGNRHAQFSDFSAQHADAAPPAPPARVTPSPAPLPMTIEAPPVEASAAARSAWWSSESPIAAPPVADPPVAVPAAAALASPAPPVIPTPVTTATGRRHIRRVHVGVAAAVVLLALAAPSVWRTFQPSPPVAPLPSRVAIDSKPPGSVVVVNGVERGKTPLVTELPAGVYRVELRYRKNVRAFDLEVVAGMPAEASVDWTKKPVIKKKATPEKGAGTKTAAVNSKPTETAKAEPESPVLPERASQEAGTPDADAAAPAEAPAPPTAPTNGL